ncbi:MAG: hypothetical protein JRG76_17330 [Deltaproteobacteria bacterium]|nr:hypothetical protein [Deltaproteobacteria bacterium]MBW2416263.1 hypothetical protein [Deltaproteobacteria bacterium]
MSSLFRTRHVALGAVLVLPLALASGKAHAADDPVGLVVGIRGQVIATAPGQEPRRLDCGDSVFADEQIETGQASRASVLIGDVYAQLFVGSQARIGVTPAGTPDLFLERGRLRIIDPRTDEASPDIRIRTPRAHSSFARNDVDAYVLGPAGATNAMLCSERTTIQVERSDVADVEPHHTPTGHCTIASLDKPFYKARVPSERIGMREAYDCSLDPRLDGFDTVDVGAPRRMPGIGNPDIGPFEPRLTCDVPGSGCGGNPKIADVQPNLNPGALP